MIRTLLVALTITLTLAAGATAADTPYRIVRPDGPGPFPVVLFVSGCSGFRPQAAPDSYDRHAERMKAAGNAVVFVDYLGARRFASCAGTIGLDEAAADIAKAVAFVRVQPVFRAEAVAVIGWSYGGGALLTALAGLAADRPAPYRAVAVYPVCGGLPAWKTQAQLLIVLGGRDEVAPPAPCQELLKRQGGVGVTVKLYPDARHGFDAEGLPPERRYPFGVIGYHAESARAAWAEIEQFLRP